MILDMLNTEAMTKVRVAYGTVINDIKEVSRSYKEAKMALDVGKIFYASKECDRIQQLRYRTSDLSAADPSVQDVHPRSI